MSKRARITLKPEEDAEPKQDTETTANPLPETEPFAQNECTAAADTTPQPSNTSRGEMLTIGAVVKTVFAGLAVAAIVLLWKNRRP